MDGPGTEEKGVLVVKGSTGGASTNVFEAFTSHWQGLLQGSLRPYQLETTHSADSVHALFPPRPARFSMTFSIGVLEHSC